MMKEDFFNDSYIPQINRIGKLTCWIGAVFVFLPAIIITLCFGITADGAPLIAAIMAQLSINAVWWIIEPVSFYPILGIPGTYLSFLSGNLSNLRIPCATAAQKAARVAIGTKEGSIVATIGVCASVFVNILMLIMGIAIGAPILSQLPAEITHALSFLMPALFGAVFAQFAIDDIGSASIAVCLGVATLLCYRSGFFNWIPIDPSIVTILIPILGTVIFARLYKYKQN